MARSSMDAGMNAPTTYIYVVKATLPTEPSSMVKIGITTNLDARLAQLRTGSAFPLDYVFTAPAPFNSLDTDAYAIEQRAHALLARNRVRGEWFDVSPELAIAAVMGAAAQIGKSLTSPALAIKSVRLWPWVVAVWLVISCLIFSQMP